MDLQALRRLPFKDPDYLQDMERKADNKNRGPLPFKDPDYLKDMDKKAHNNTMGPLPIKDPDYLKDMANREFPRKVTLAADELWGKFGLMYSMN